MDEPTQIDLKALFLKRLEEELRALREALSFDVQIETSETEESRTFKEILATRGVKAAIAWREARFAAPGNTDTITEGADQMTYTALVVDKTEGGVTQSIKTLNNDTLPKGDVTVAVEYSSVNYKDGLCLTATGGLVREFPHVPGIDYAGTVEHSADPRYMPGDKVVPTGWRVGENHWGAMPPAPASRQTNWCRCLRA